MSKNKKGLGMGLEALLKMNVAEESDNRTDNGGDSDAQPQSKKEVIAGFVELEISRIVPNPDQPRKNFDETALNELAQSIKNYGLIQPITVIKNDDVYEIIAGERRYRAAKIAGLTKIPVIIKDLSQRKKLEMSLVENIQRENLNSIEEALAYSSLIDTYNITQEELASSIGKSRTTITNSMRLLNLDAQIRSFIMQGKITPGHARAILSINDVVQHVPFARYIIDHKLSVREAESLAKKWPLKKHKAAKQEPVKDVALKNAEEKLKQRLQTKVMIAGTSKKGKIQIDYFTQEELERIIEVIGVKL